MAGQLIAVEGIDGAGTTTQSRALFEWLTARGRDCVLTAEPSTGPVGRLLRGALRSEPILDEAAMALLFAADRLDHLTREIKPALDDDLTVITDRYLFSSLAYQSIGNNPAWVETINGLARPADLTIVLDAPVDVCLQRVKARDGWLIELYEKDSFLGRVRKLYLDLAGQRDKEGEAVAVIDATEPIEEVSRRVAAAAAERLGLPR